MAAMLAWAKRMPETLLSEPPKYWNFPKPAARLGVEGTTSRSSVSAGSAPRSRRRALAFDMHVRALRRTDAPSPVAGVEVVRSLDELVAGRRPSGARRARHGHARGTSSTPTVLARMKPGVHLVNIARGSLVDQDALRVALDDGPVAMATLDTVDPEPLPAGHWLYAHPKVRMTAHISWYTPQLQAAAVDIFIENIGRFAAGEPLLHVVDPDEGY